MKNLPLIQKSLSLSTMIVLTIAILLPHGGSARAQENKVAEDGIVLPASSQRQGPTDPIEMESFLDGLFTKELQEHHIAGAAISVVKDGKLFFAKGYGYADLANKIPVDTQQTVFRVGSVGKVFTWTAVMQLVEQGKLDLDADINGYLDFHIPDTYSQPITLTHLLAHTAGFEDLYIETLTLNAAEQKPVGEWLATHIPARVHAPGECAAYSNYGAELAGYIIAQVSGQTYDHYIQEHIFDPLEMTRSTALWNKPPNLRAHESIGYTYADGAFQPVPDEDDYSGQPAVVPAGAHASSATDMARFMVAFLQVGRDNDALPTDAHILKDATTQQMLSTLYAADPRLPGTAYGFFDFSDNEQRTLGHNGSTLGFNTLLLLLPDENLGVFVAYNAEDVGDLTRQHFGFHRAFFDHYYPKPPVEPIQPPMDFAKRASQFEGSYRITRRAYTTIETYASMMSTLEVKDSGDGSLIVTTPWGAWQFVEVGPLYFRQADGPFHMVFREDDQGQIDYMFLEIAPQFAFEKISWYATPQFNMVLLSVCLMMFLSVLPVAIIRFIRDRRLNGNQNRSPRRVRVADWLIVVSSILNLLFIAGSAVWGQQLVFGVPFAYKVVLGFGVLSATLTVGALLSAALAWKGGYWSVAFRTYYTLVTIAAAAFIWFLNYWNLLGWQY